MQPVRDKNRSRNLADEDGRSQDATPNTLTFSSICGTQQSSAPLHVKQCFSGCSRYTCVCQIML